MLGRFWRTVYVRGVASLVIAGCVMAAATPAMAAGTGDCPARARDRLTLPEAAGKAQCEEQASSEGSGVSSDDGEASIEAIVGDYYYVWTPSHKQERSYWCGPATVQVIDDYWGAYVPQSVYAAFMGTTTAGTVFSRVDDAIRFFTGRSYYYYPNLTKGGLSEKVRYSLYIRHSPLAVDVNIRAYVWPLYEYDHPGHIIPIDGFSWSNNTVRVNDVYDEAEYHADGGHTYGHHQYSFDVLWDGVSHHFLQAVVCPG